MAGWLAFSDVAPRIAYAETGSDLRGSTFEHFFRTDLVGAASVAVGGGHLDVALWREGGPERVVREH